MSLYSVAFNRAQSAHDNQQPPEEYCPGCGREVSVDCICTGEIIDPLEEEDQPILGEG